jgi:membrane-associated protease RseP (regulator of RpoE activity)
MEVDLRKQSHRYRVAIIAFSVLVSVGAGNPAPASASSRPVGNGPFYFWRGIDMRPVARSGDAHALGEGMLVERIQRGSPAARAGLRRGDVITAIDGAAVGTARSLAMAIADYCCGSKVALTVWRGHNKRTIELPRR